MRTLKKFIRLISALFFANDSRKATAPRLNKKLVIRRKRLNVINAPVSKSAVKLTEKPQIKRSNSLKRKALIKSRKLRQKAISSFPCTIQRQDRLSLAYMLSLISDITVMI